MRGKNRQRNPSHANLSAQDPVGPLLRQVVQPVPAARLREGVRSQGVVEVDLQRLPRVLRSQQRLHEIEFLLLQSTHSAPRLLGPGVLSLDFVLLAAVRVVHAVVRVEDLFVEVAERTLHHLLVGEADDLVPVLGKSRTLYVLEMLPLVLEP